MIAVDIADRVRQPRVELETEPAARHQHQPPARRDPRPDAGGDDDVFARLQRESERSADIVAAGTRCRAAGQCDILICGADGPCVQIRK